MAIIFTQGGRSHNPRVLVLGAENPLGCQAATVASGMRLAIGWIQGARAEAVREGQAMCQRRMNDFFDPPFIGS